MKQYKKWIPKIGEEVSVLYDGKLGRRVKGTVLSLRGFCLTVIFDEWGGNAKDIKHTFVRTSPISFGGYVPVENGLMDIAFGLQGDWYSVMPNYIVEERIGGPL